MNHFLLKLIKMFDLNWVHRMLWGLDNIIKPATIEFIGYQKKRMMENDMTSIDNSLKITGDEKLYILGIAMYFDMKIYQNSKLIKLKKEQTFTLN